MNRLPVRSVLTNLWSLLTLKHAAVVCLSLWALSVQLAYRAPSRVLFLLLPWVGVALSALSVTFLLGHLLARIATDDPFVQALRRVEWWASLLVRIFIYYSLVLYANGKLDWTDPVDDEMRVVNVVGGELDVGLRIPYGWIELKSRGVPERTVRLLLRPGEDGRLWVGEAVVLRTQRGFLGLPWVSGIDRDEHRHSRAILELAPTAVRAWKNLINFYLDHRRWRDASAAAKQYFELYPHDVDFALAVAAGFGTAYRPHEAAAVLEPFLARQPTYEVYDKLGWAMWKLGRTARAIQLLEAAIALDADSAWAYYHLGYVYRDAGRLEQAVAMFQKVLERRPHYPEIQAQVAAIRKALAAQPPDQPRR